jgi:ABC-type transport system substrate-binding protein
VTAQDALFFIDQVRAAVKESGANWGTYSPGLGLPDQVTSASAPNATTLVIHLNKPVNPTWFTDDQLALIQPMPVHAWARAAANGPVLDFTTPANDWGDMLNKGVSELQNGYWWQVYPVGICIIVVVMACNLLGDALRDALDVRLRRR